ncbi:hypothetical protein [Haloparvum sp. PAK95]|uniref:hypothetical protein n=1 Tax=Haloparvum sp. PAK95 TaxID=3418962 RepID=UPI003D2F0B3E
MKTNRGLSTVAWGIAGLPLVVTFVQTILALLDWTSKTVGVHGVLGPLFEVGVVFEAAVVFKQQPALVTLLFLFIAVAWGVQGLAMRTLDNRDVAVAAAGFAAVTYLVLFFGVYSELLSQGIGTGQLVIFFSIPIAASMLVVGGALTHDWEQDVINQASGRIGNIEAEIEAARQEFDSTFHEQIGDLEKFEHVAPSGVAEARSEQEAFHDRCDDLSSELQELEREVDATRLQGEVSRIESRLAELDPETSVDRIARDLRQRVRSGVRTELGGISVASRFGGEYTLSNLPTEYREVALLPEESAVHVDDVGDVLERQLDQGTELAAIGDAVTTAVEHRDEVETFLGEREDEAADRISTVESRIDTVEEQLDRFPDPVARRIREVLIDNRDEDVHGAAAIERQVRDAKTSLQECKFDDCDRLLETVEERSQRLLTAVEFLRSLDGRLSHGGSSVDIPQDVDEALVAAVVPSFAAHYDVDVAIDSGRVEIGSGEDSGTRHPPHDTGSADDTSSPSDTGSDDLTDDLGDDETSKRPAEVLDSALYLLREIEEQAREADDDRIQYQTSELPPGIGTPSTLSNVERFLSHQSDLFDEVTLQSTDPPAFLEVVVSDGSRPPAAVRTARERFIERYD